MFQFSPAARACAFTYLPPSSSRHPQNHQEQVDKVEVQPQSAYHAHPAFELGVASQEGVRRRVLDPLRVVSRQAHEEGNANTGIERIPNPFTVRAAVELPPQP